MGACAGSVPRGVSLRGTQCPEHSRDTLEAPCVRGAPSTVTNFMTSSGCSMEGALVHGQNWVYLAFFDVFPSLFYSIFLAKKNGFASVKILILGFIAFLPAPMTIFAENALFGQNVII